MKESKKRENSHSKKKKHAKSANTDSWDQSDLEFADEKALEKRLHQLQLQLRMTQEEATESGHSNKHVKNKKKPPSDDSASSDSDDSSDSDSSFSSASSSSVNRYGNRKSSSGSEDDRKKRVRASLNNKHHVKDSKSRRSPVKNERDRNSSRNDRKPSVVRRKISPVHSKHNSRVRSKRSPSLDKKEVYSRGDTSRWHEKAKEAGRERSKYEKERSNSKSRVRGRSDRNRSPSVSRDRTSTRSKERSVKNFRTTSVSSRRKESPEQRPRAYDSGRRAGATFIRKNSPREDRLGSRHDDSHSRHDDSHSRHDDSHSRHDDKRLDLKVTTRRNDIRAGDIRDSNLRITKDIRGDRKEPLSMKIREPSRDREPLKLRRESPVHRADPRDRSRVIDDRMKDRDKKVHDRLEPERNNRNIRNDNRDILDDKFRRNDRSSDTIRPNNRHVNESVFDRMRNRYNDRRNAENQRFARTERDRVGDLRKDRLNDKDTIKNRTVESNGADRPFRDRRIAPIPRARSPYRDRNEPLRVNHRTPIAFERKFSSPTATRKAREDNRLVHNKRKSTENDDPQWNKKKGLNSKTRSRSRSSEKRKRRRSSQEEWRIIDMTSPVLDEELSDGNANNAENNAQKLNRPGNNKIRNKLKTEESDDNDSKLNKTILTDELSDISDEDFNDINTNSIKHRKDNLTRPDRQFRLDKNNRKSYQPKEDLNLDKPAIDQDNKATITTTPTTTTTAVPNEVDDLIETSEKINDEETRVDIEKNNEHLDSEEDTVSRVSDAIGVDWAELVEESKQKIPAIEESSKLIRKRWSGVNMFAKIGISEKYAGKELYDEVQHDLYAEDNTDDKNVDEKLHHSVAGLHVCLRDKAIKRKTLFEPYKTAISARKDIIMRRRLCGLPVKNINTQQMIGICNWIV